MLFDIILFVCIFPQYSLSTILFSLHHVFVFCAINKIFFCYCSLCRARVKWAWKVHIILFLCKLWFSSSRKMVQNKSIRNVFVCFFFALTTKTFIYNAFQSFFWCFIRSLFSCSSLHRFSPWNSFLVACVFFAVSHAHWVNML